MLTEETLYRDAYNAHERAELMALEAMRAHLRTASSEALMCLADPQWRWETRSWMSLAIVDAADDILTERLNVAVA